MEATRPSDPLRAVLHQDRSLSSTFSKENVCSLSGGHSTPGAAQVALKTMLTSNHKTLRGSAAVLALAALGLNGSCVPVGEKSVEVTATAYNSHPSQTDNTPNVAAWGDVLRPGMKTIAVSRDLIRLGVGRGTRVRIEGFSGRFVVLDKMAPRKRRRIDIYMGDDIEKARAWGRRRIRVYWFGNWIKESAKARKR